MVRFAAGALPVTDDRSVVDFTTPRHARANFGLGEWVTGGLTAAGVGELGLRSELGLREFDRIYAFRDSPLPLVAYLRRRSRPEAFVADVRARAGRREMKAAAPRDRQRATARRRPAHARPAGAQPRGGRARPVARAARGERSASRDAGAAPARDGRGRPARGESARRGQGEPVSRKRKPRGAGGPAARPASCARRARGAERRATGSAGPALAVPRRGPRAALGPAAARRAAAAGRRLRRVDGLRAAPGRRRRAAPPQQPALHVALLRPRGRARAVALLARGPRSRAGPCRVFVLGSSAAQGDPEPAFGVARLLEVLLRDQYPGVELEVVNAAATAINSHYVYQAARACLALEPDVLVVYAGNNEVVGPFGAGTVLSASAPPLPLVRAQLAAQRSRMGQLVARSLRAAGRGLGGGRAAGAWHGMEMFLEQQVSRDDAALQRSYRNYERNLADTCRLAREADVPVVLSTIAVNLRSCGPVRLAASRVVGRGRARALGRAALRGRASRGQRPLAGGRRAAAAGGSSRSRPRRVVLPARAVRGPARARGRGTPAPRARPRPRHAALPCRLAHERDRPRGGPPGGRTPGRRGGVVRRAVARRPARRRDLPRPRAPDVRRQLPPGARPARADPRVAAAGGARPGIGAARAPDRGGGGRGWSTASSTATASPRRCSCACATRRSRTSRTTPST